ncbi:MAG: NADH-quinone oxidoreductase subunit J [Candidatus Azobacteroides pseudotrichonymphae]|jgi:NADH-quinone oxidoreductase subunit J|nr:NADH-quinone oxidoreductase subunit J [Bacteroidales bacterium OttesenSCG-928-I14]GMO32015.1 MAG: NADH-quinone oxidoreductase subunit J [Candidatus Azobacteroides pseudotrichonymphae]
MNPVVNLIIFICLGIASLLFSILAVSSNSLLRSATYLFLVLLCTAGFYLFLNYHFLAAVQVSVYAGGIVVLFIFAIFLTNDKSEVLIKKWWQRCTMSVFVILGGIATTAFALLKHRFIYINKSMLEGDREIDMHLIGKALMGTGKYQYLLPFEILSLLLLACIIGAILIARKR